MFRRTDHPKDRNNVSPTVKRRKSSVDLSLVIAFSALITSLISIAFTIRLQRDTSTVESIKEEYATFYDLDRIALDHWQVSHVFAAPEYYPAVSAQIAAALAPLNAASQAQYELQERKAASYIFDYFEQTLYQYRHAQEVGDAGRVKFQGDVLSYLTRSQLRNPRLLWYWSESGGNLRADYEDWTKNYYDQAVLRNSQNLLTVQPDPIGPFKRSTLAVKNGSSSHKKSVR